MSDKLVDELKPCPFCGSADSKTGHGTVRRHKNRAPNLGVDRYHFHVRCGHCGFNGPRGLTDEQSVAGWNTRAESQRPAREAVAPFAYVIPGDDNANVDGWIDCRATSEGEFTKPVYASPPPAAVAAQGVVVPSEPICDSELRIITQPNVYGENIPEGIRDKTGYLFFFHPIQRYEGQGERYTQDVKRLNALADYLLKALLNAAGAR
jgi:Lar family restriction alleviation protein